MKLKHILLVIGTTLALTGCSSSQKNSINDVSNIEIGNSLEIQNIDKSLKLLDHNDALAANGLYYTSWGIGNARDYENEEGKTVDLYDAQLYLLLAEETDPKKAKNSLDSWMETGRLNYDIISEEEITCDKQTYSIITYNCKGADNPYDHGVSAFAINGDTAVCIELTCMDNFDKDLKNLLTDFLAHCHYQ